MQPLILATRASSLALTQSQFVKKLLEQTHAGLKVELLPLTTSGDQIQDKALRTVGGKGLFVKEIEEALLSHKAHFAVHSLKDVPAELPSGLKLGVFLRREDPSDVLISSEFSLNTLPQGARLGTSSLRRKIQVLQQRPDLQILELRGNVDTRLRKLKEGQFDAIVLAFAGLKRLGLEKNVSEMLSFIPSPGQGALALEYREDDPQTASLLKSLHHSDTALCVEAEREILKEFEGGCEIPLGALAYLEKEKFHLKVFLALPDGSQIIQEEVEGDFTQSQKLTLEMIQILKKRGADQIARRYRKS